MDRLQLQACKKTIWQNRKSICYRPGKHCMCMYAPIKFSLNIELSVKVGGKVESMHRKGLWKKYMNADAHRFESESISTLYKACNQARKFS